MELNITENNDSLHDQSLSPLPIKYRPRHRRVITSPDITEENNETLHAVPEQNATPKKRNRKKHNVSSKSVAEPKEKRWNAQDDRRLKMALKIAVNPQSDEDWNIIAKSVNRTAKECREHAQKIGGFQFSTQLDLSSIPFDGDFEKPSVRKSKSNIEARKIIDADVDFFGSQRFGPDISDIEFDADDSLLLALETPDGNPVKTCENHSLCQ